MHLFHTIFCRVPGDYLVHSSALRSLTPEAWLVIAQSIALLMMLPLTFYWMYRRRRWISMATAAVLFLTGVDYLMLTDHGSMAQTFVGALVLSGMPCAVSTLWLEISRSAGRRLRAGAGTSLSATALLILAGLAISFYLLCFFAVTLLEVPGRQSLAMASNFINCLFCLPRPADLVGWENAAHMLMALAPASMLTIVLHAWCCRRASNRLALPRPLYVIAVAGLACGVLIPGALILEG